MRIYILNTRECHACVPSLVERVVVRASPRPLPRASQNTQRTRARTRERQTTETTDTTTHDTQPSGYSVAATEIDTRAYPSCHGSSRHRVIPIGQSEGIFLCIPVDAYKRHTVCCTSRYYCGNKYSVVIDACIMSALMRWYVCMGTCGAPRVFIKSTRLDMSQNIV